MKEYCEYCTQEIKTDDLEIAFKGKIYCSMECLEKDGNK